MSPTRQFALIFISALMGGLLALAGFIGWEGAHPQQTVVLPAGQSVSSGGGQAAAARQAASPLGNTPLAGLVDTIGANTGIGADPEEQVFTAVYREAAPCVVHIHTTSQVPTWFGVQEAKGSGSGVIISKDGYILTNTFLPSAICTSLAR